MSKEAVTRSCQLLFSEFPNDYCFLVLLLLHKPQSRASGPGSTVNKVFIGRGSEQWASQPLNRKEPPTSFPGQVRHICRLAVLPREEARKVMRNRS